jgi:hypothetical protein
VPLLPPLERAEVAPELRDLWDECARSIEELTWRTAQCVAFNWHNDFLELEVGPEAAVREPHPPPAASRAAS